MNKILLAITFSLVSIHASASDNPLKQSIAILESNYGDMTVEMIKLDDNKWKLSSKLVGTGIKREEAEYLYLEDNFVRPIEYKFSQRILFFKEKNSANFNWDDYLVNYTKKGKSGSVQLEDMVLGPSSAQLQLRLDFRELDLNNLPKFLKYKVYWKGAVKERFFDIQKEPEEIKTAMGSYLSYKVSRRYDSGESKSQIFWLAPDLDFSVIQIFNDDGKRAAEIKIKSLAEID
tara:strand:- start:66 stop:761 length:696 start_codon:yes stop_codon:yes gene_type:complete